MERHNSVARKPGDTAGLELPRRNRHLTGVAVSYVALAQDCHEPGKIFEIEVGDLRDCRRARARSDERGH